MTIKYGTTLRNAKMDVIETTVGASPKLRVYTGAAPTNPGDAATGTQLAEIALPSDWMAAAAAGVKAKSGTWEDAAADADGTAGYFRIWDNGVAVCHIQGSCSGPGGGGDMIIDNPVLATGQKFTVVTFSLTDGNS
jgi:hypothetical protein